MRGVASGFHPLNEPATQTCFASGFTNSIATWAAVVAVAGGTVSVFAVGLSFLIILAIVINKQLSEALRSIHRNKSSLSIDYAELEIFSQARLETGRELG